MDFAKLFTKDDLRTINDLIFKRMLQNTANLHLKQALGSSDSLEYMRFINKLSSSEIERIGTRLSGSFLCIEVDQERLREVFERAKKRNQDLDVLEECIARGASNAFVNHYWPLVDDREIVKTRILHDVYKAGGRRKSLKPMEHILFSETWCDMGLSIKTVTAVQVLELQKQTDLDFGAIEVEIESLRKEEAEKTTAA